MNTKKWGKLCWRCDLAFSPSMLRWHVKHGHRILQCKLCGKAIYVYGIAPTTWPRRSEFCSEQCKETAESRGLCPYCLKEPDDTFSKGTCGECRRRYRAMKEAIRRVDGELHSIHSARYAPATYHRAIR